jgi:hypothetical protein
MRCFIGETKHFSRKFVRFTLWFVKSTGSGSEVLTLEAHDSLFFSLLPVGSVAIDSQISARKIALIHHVYPHLHFIFSAKFISFGLIPSNLGTVLLSRFVPNTLYALDACRMPSQVMDPRRHLSQFSNPTVAASSFSEEQFRLPTEVIICSCRIVAPFIGFSVFVSLC